MPSLRLDVLQGKSTGDLLWFVAACSTQLAAVKSTNPPVELEAARSSLPRLNGIVIWRDRDFE